MFVLAGIIFFVAILLFGAHLMGWFSKSPSSGTAATATPPVPKTLVNPLNIQEGQYVTLSTLDEQGIQFKVEHIAEYARVLHGNRHTFTDYFLFAQKPGEEPIRMKIRMNPSADKLPIGMNQKILKLQLTDSSDWNQDLYNVLTTSKPDKTPDDPDFIEYNDDDTVKAQWWRLNGVQTPYEATVREQQGGRLTNNDVEYWDYSRDVKIEASERTQYLFVEMTKDAHQFEFWTGVEIDESEIS